MKIAIDIMVEQHPSKDLINGVLLSAKEDKENIFILVGDENYIWDHFPERPSNVRILPSKNIILPKNEPEQIIHYKESSMIKAINLVKNKFADGVISASNPELYFTAAVSLIKPIDNINTPALPSIFPTINGSQVMILDTSASLCSNSKQLLQYAKMGNIYSREVLGEYSPRIGLLNVGKGNNQQHPLIKETFQLLKMEKMNFIGYVTPQDVLSGGCDVIVADGFSGNVLVQSFEGSASSFFFFLKNTMEKDLKSKIGSVLFKNQISSISQKMKKIESFGSPILGLNRPVFKIHHASDAQEIYETIQQIKIFTELSLIDEFKNSN